MNNGIKEQFASELESATGILRDRGKSAGNQLVVETTIPDELVVVGDLHGDLGSLEKILSIINYEKFLCDPKTKIVFLGDYVDRGKNSVRVLFRLVTLQLQHPDSMILMRGNHEAPDLFPFKSHTLATDLKASGLEDEIYQKLLTYFGLLPLTTLVRDRLVLVHGGVPISLPVRSKDPGETIIQAAKEDPRFVEQILWNDPRDQLSEPGAYWEKSRRSYGFHYGETITEGWLQLLGVRVLIRGHEPCRGFKIMHKDKVLTLFSCKESYPNFEAAFIHIKKEGIESLKKASDLVEYVHMI